MKKQYKQKMDTFSFRGLNRGISSDTSHVIPPGYGKNISNFRFHTKGLKTRLAVKTLEKALPGSFDSASPSSGGWDSSTYGRFVDFAGSSSGKLIVFEGGGVVDTDTSSTWQSASLNVLDMTPVSQNILGCVYFSDKFLVYTKNYLYSVSTADGTLTEEVDFSSDVGSDYSPIVRIIPRFGQLWVITKNDKIFWSDGGEYSVAAESQKTTNLEKEWNVWQTVDYAKLASIDSVDSYKQNPRKLFDSTSGECTPITKDTDYVFAFGSTGGLSDGDTIQVGNFERTIDTGGVEPLVVNLDDSYSAGMDYINVDENMSGNDAARHAIYHAVKQGYSVEITIEETGKTNTHSYIEYYYFFFDSFAITTPLQDNYTSSATVTVTTITKVSFTTTFGSTQQSANLATNIVTSLTQGADYEQSLTPADDDNADGHIKLLETAKVKDADWIKVAYTPSENDWRTGNAGYIDINPSKGDNIDAVAGPDYTEAEGSSLIYLFKDNGYVYAIVGKPGQGGTMGSLDIRFMAGGLTVRPGTLQTTRSGVYFGAFDGIEYKVMFIPHSQSYGMYDITDEFNFDVNIPFDNRDNYNFYEVTGILHGDQYAICFPNSTSGLPSSNGELYLGKAFKSEKERTYKGRWTKFKTNIENEWEDANSSHDALGLPQVTGIYRFKGRNYFCYYVKTSHDYSGSTRFYEIAQYGQHDGGEECKDKWVMTLDTTGDSSADTAQYCSEHFWAVIRTGFVRIADRVNLKKIHFDGIDVVGGSNADGIEITWDIFQDLDESTSASNFPKTGSDFTDASGNLKLLVEEKINFECRYFQVYMKFANINYNTHPAYIVFRDILVDYAPHSEGSVLTQEHIDYS